MTRRLNDRGRQRTLQVEPKTLPPFGERHLLQVKTYVGTFHLDLDHYELGLDPISPLDCNLMGGCQRPKL